jgi:hypothetical protein
MESGQMYQLQARPLPLWKKRFCNYCKKRNRLEEDCWKKRKDLSNDETKTIQAISARPENSTYVTFMLLPTESLVCSVRITVGSPEPGCREALAQSPKTIKVERDLV